MATIYKTVEVIFDANGNGKITRSQDVEQNLTTGIAAPQLTKTAKGLDYVNSDIYNEIRLRLVTGGKTIFENIPLSFFEPTSIRKFAPVSIPKVDLNSSEIFYKGATDISGKAVELIFEVEER